MDIRSLCVVRIRIEEDTLCSKGWQLLLAFESSRRGFYSPLPQQGQEVNNEADTPGNLVPQAAVADMGIHTSNIQEADWSEVLLGRRSGSLQVDSLRMG